MLEFNIYIVCLTWIVPLVLLVGIGFYIDDRELAAYNKKRYLKQLAAEYDRLRDEEFRELGWTGKY